MDIEKLISSPDGWVNDDRGKPCLWIAYRDFTETEIYEDPGVGSDSIMLRTGRELMERCNKALKELTEGPELYVVRCPPEAETYQYHDSHRVRIHVRCRVRWCKDQETIDRWKRITDGFHETAAAGGYTENI